MKNYKILYLLLVLICMFTLTRCTYGKEEKGDTAEKRENEEATKFLTFYIRSILKKDTISLLENSHDEFGNNCLTKSIDSIKKKIPLIKQDIHFKWPKIPNAKILKDTDLPNRYTISWKDFKKKHPRGFYQISKPIFSKKFDFAVLLQSYTCEERCGTSWIEIYKKDVKGNWKQTKKRICWIS